MSVLPIIAALVASAPSSVELTIYNQGFGLVKETRSFELRAGRQTISVEDVAQRIETNSVGIKSLTKPGSISVVEQNYRFDLISPQAILNKAVGSRITIVQTSPTGERRTIKGVLLSSPGQGGIVLKADSGEILLNPSGEIIVDDMPKGMVSRPTLVWDLETNSAGPQNVEVSYLTQGLSWTADYVMSLDRDGQKGDLKGWVTLVNSSGATFENAKLKLLAGDVARAQPRMPGGGGRAGAPANMAMQAKADMVQEQFAEYHLYTLGRPTTVAQNEQKQVSLLEATDITATKRLIIDPMRGYYGYQPGEGEIGTGILKAQVRIELQNKKENRMGMPLPEGTVKVFQRDSSGALQLLGEDRIEHTPKDEKISLVVGKAFDIVAERKREKFEWIRRSNGSIRGARETFTIEVRNRKESPETVEVIERHWGQWTITQKNMEFEKVDSDTLLFLVKLGANEVKKVTYTIETVW